MLLTNYKTYFDDICIALKEIKKKEPPKDYCKKVIFYLENCKIEINEWLRNHNFPTEEEEIFFFKCIKPKLTSKIIYYRIIQTIELKLPTSNKAQSKYYEKVLIKYSQIPNNLKSFNLYIRNEATHRDLEYFLRKNNVSDIDNQHLFAFLDERTTTKMELALAELIAKEKVIKYIESKLAEMETNSNSIKPVSNLKWTGTKIEIIELIYAIHHLKVINNGNTDIKEVSSAMEKLFNIELNPHLYGTYQDIKKRKTGQTKFLNNLSECLRTILLNDEI